MFLSFKKNKRLMEKTLKLEGKCGIIDLNVEYIIFRAVIPQDAVLKSNASAMSSKFSAKFTLRAKSHHQLSTMLEIGSLPDPQLLVDLWNFLYLERTLKPIFSSVNFKNLFNSRNKSDIALTGREYSKTFSNVLLSETIETKD